jgi:polyhydroxybutyrate depolymerase
MPAVNSAPCPIHRLLLLGLVSLGLALSLSACSTLDNAAENAYSLVKASAPHGETVLHIERNGASRTAFVSLPPGFGKRPRYPVVIDLHGENSNALAEMRASGLNAAAAERGFVAVFPNASGEQDPSKALLESQRLTWRPGDPAADELGFLGELIDTLVNSYRADPKRIYVVGFSSGATMAYRVGCELSHKIAGLGAVGGAMDNAACRPVKPLPLLLFHATGDSVVPYAGDLSNGSVTKTVAFWTRNNHCETGAETTRKSEFIKEYYQDPQGLGSVLVYTLFANEHGWPVADKTNAAWIMLDFFTKQGAR